MFSYSKLSSLILSPIPYYNAQLHQPRLHCMLWGRWGGEPVAKKISKNIYYALQQADQSPWVCWNLCQLYSRCKSEKSQRVGGIGWKIQDNTQHVWLLPTLPPSPLKCSLLLLHPNSHSNSNLLAPSESLRPAAACVTSLWQQSARVLFLLIFCTAIKDLALLEC